MTIDTYLQVVFWLSLGGTLFAGYIVAHQLILKECPFNEPCPYFLGRPACEYGFMMFLAIFAATALTHTDLLSTGTAANIVLWVSLLGTFFAGYFVAAEFMEWLRSGAKRYGLVLPTCAYGLGFFIAIAVLSLTR